MLISTPYIVGSARVIAIWKITLGANTLHGYQVRFNWRIGISWGFCGAAWCTWLYISKKAKETAAINARPFILWPAEHWESVHAYKASLDFNSCIL